MKKDWKTTTLGVLTLITLWSAAAQEFLTTGTISNLGVLIPSTMTAVGLIFAKDTVAQPKP